MKRKSKRRSQDNIDIIEDSEVKLLKRKKMGTNENDPERMIEKKNSFERKKERKKTKMSERRRG